MIEKKVLTAGTFFLKKNCYEQKTLVITVVGSFVVSLYVVGCWWVLHCSGIKYTGWCVRCFLAGDLPD